VAELHPRPRKWFVIPPMKPITPNITIHPQFFIFDYSVTTRIIISKLHGLIHKNETLHIWRTQQSIINLQTSSNKLNPNIITFQLPINEYYLTNTTIDQLPKNHTKLHPFEPPSKISKDKNI
jgi:hypothetical protein